MITEQDLQAAIAECQGQRNPTANTCIKLAAFYTIRNELFGDKEQRPDKPLGYSFASGPYGNNDLISFESDSEFGRLVNGKQSSAVWPVIDELLDTLKTLYPRLYVAFMNKLK